MLTFNDAADASRRHLAKLFVPHADRASCFCGDEKFEANRHFRDPVFSPGYVHGYNGRGCVAARRDAGDPGG